MRIAILANGQTVNNFTNNPTISVDKYDQVWGLNQQGTWKGLTLDKLFVMDDLKLRMPFYAGYDLVEWLKTYPGEIVTSKAYDEWPTSVSYPIKEIAHYFGMPLGTAMYSTPDYMIALAIYQGATQIDLFGVDMATEGPIEMKLGTAQWIGAAHARGVLVRTFVGSLFQYLTNNGVTMESGLYGYAKRPRIEELVNTDYYEAWSDARS
jgi:hypothetical protein